MEKEYTAEEVIQKQNNQIQQLSKELREQRNQTSHYRILASALAYKLGQISAVADSAGEYIEKARK